MKYLLALCFVGLTYFCFAQNNYIILKGSVSGFKNINAIKVISTIKSGTTFNFEDSNLLPVKSDGTFNEKLPLARVQSLFIEYAEGAHEIIACAGDTINITFSRMQKPDTVKSEMLTNIIYEKLYLEGTNKYQNSFIDSLETRFGIIGDFIEKPPGNIASQKIIIDSLYNLRINYLNNYAIKFKLSNAFKDIAYNEIRGSYINSLITRLFRFNRDDFPKDYFSELNSEKFTWEKCSKSRQYMSAARSYCTYYLRTTPFGQVTDEENLKEQFNIIVSAFKDVKLRDYLLTFLMNDYVERHPSNFDEIYHKYMMICKDQSYMDALTVKYKGNNKLINNQIPKSVLSSTRLINLADNSEINLKELINKQKSTFILIDFWAGWCGPCLIQMPYLLPFESRFSKNVSFIFLSLDKDMISFKNSVKISNLKGEQYLLKGGFNSSFAKYIKMKSIPRYLLLNNKFNIIETVTPLPTNKKAFEKMLNALRQ